MDINEAALELKKLEIIESQITHLQREAEAGLVEYASECNKLAQELILTRLVKTALT